MLMPRNGIQYWVNPQTNFIFDEYFIMGENFYVAGMHYTAVKQSHSMRLVIFIFIVTFDFRLFCQLWAASFE